MNNVDNCRAGHLAGRIKELRGNMSKVQFASILNISPAYAGMLEKGEREPGASLTELICQRFKVNKPWLINGTGSKYSTDINIIQRGTKEDTLNYWHRLEVATGTAPDISKSKGPIEMQGVNIYPPEILKVFDQHFKPTDMLILPMEYINRGSVGLRMQGDAMTPTIRSGAIIGVSYKDFKFIDGNIYVVRARGDIYIRRLCKSPGKLLLIADNPKVPDIDVDLAEAEIIGEIGWIIQFSL